MNEEPLNEQIGQPASLTPNPPRRVLSSATRISGCLLASLYGPAAFLVVLGGFPIAGACLLIVGLVFSLTNPRSHAAHWTRRFGFLIRWGTVASAIGLIYGWHVYERHIDSLVVPTSEYRESAWPPAVVRLPPLSRSVALDEPPELTLPADDMPVIDGATSIFPLYQVLADYVFQSMPSQHRQRVKVSTTAVAYNDLIAGKADIVFAFPPSGDEMRRASRAGRELAATPIGRDAFVFIASAENPVTSLTARQLKDIYAGRVRRWTEIGGSGGLIIPFQREPNSGSQSRMERFMDGDRLAPARTEWRVDSMAGLVERVARYRDYRESIGYSFLFYIQNMVNARGLKLLEVDGVPPTPETISNGNYPLTDTICAVTAGTEHPSVGPFIQWILSPQGQRLVKKAGYVALAAAWDGETP